jgi:hypothetical protein
MESIMSNDTTKSVKVLSDAREEEILSIFRTLHGKVLTALQECDIAAQFHKEWGDCEPKDYKVVHQQARALLSAKMVDRNEKRLSGIRIQIQSVVSTYMERARGAKAQLDALRVTMGEAGAALPAFPKDVKVPLSEVRACFPTGTGDAQVFSDLEYMGYKLNDLSPKGQVLVPFVAAEEKSAEVVKAA